METYYKVYMVSEIGNFSTDEPIISTARNSREALLKCVPAGKKIIKDNGKNCNANYCVHEVNSKKLLMRDFRKRIFYRVEG